MPVLLLSCLIMGQISMDLYMNGAATRKLKVLCIPRQLSTTKTWYAFILIVEQMLTLRMCQKPWI